MTNSKNNNSNSVFALADIGGTNARFALYTPGSDGDIQLREQRQFRLILNWQVCITLTEALVFNRNWSRHAA